MKHLICIFACGVILAGCGSPTPSAGTREIAATQAVEATALPTPKDNADCSRLIGLKQMDFEAFRARNAAQFAVSASKEPRWSADVLSTRLYDQNNSYEINYRDGATFVGTFREPQVPTITYFATNQRSLALGKVIACLGNPSSYLAMAPRTGNDEQVGPTLLVFYPEYGIHLWVSELGKNRSAFENLGFLQFQVIQVQRVQAGDTVTILKRIYLEHGRTDAPATHIANIHDWPNPLKDLIVLSE